MLPPLLSLTLCGLLLARSRAGQWVTSGARKVLELDLDALATELSLPGTPPRGLNRLPESAARAGLWHPEKRITRKE